MVKVRTVAELQQAVDRWRERLTEDENRAAGAQMWRACRLKALETRRQTDGLTPEEEAEAVALLGLSMSGETRTPSDL